MGMSRSEKEIAAAQKELREQTSKAVKDFDTSGGFQRFAPSQLQNLRPELKGSTSFLGGGVSPYAQSMAYQRLPGMTYANLPGTTTAFYPQANIPTAPVASAPPPTTGTTAPLYKSIPATETDLINDTDVTRRENELLLAELIGDENERRFEEAGNELANMREFERTLAFEKAIREGPFKLPDYEDLIDEENRMITMADGGIASLPVEMSAGGTLAAPGQTLGGTPAGGLMSLDVGGVGGAGVGMNPTMPSPVETPSDQKESSKKQSRYANMTKEQLIALLEQQNKSDLGAELTALGKALTPQPLADGGDVDFPRMNGPISGPGTETSDDIPAMLSDGEFVVNAKAVRGVGRMNGAGKSKEEQRREGARMMYALQKAGEQAMRKA